MCFIHKFGKWEEVRKGTLGEQFEKGLTIENKVTGEIDTTISPCGDYIVQKRTCQKCNFVELDRQEVFE